MKREDVDIILITAEPIRQQYDALVKGGKKGSPAGGSWPSHTEQHLCFWEINLARIGLIVC